MPDSNLSQTLYTTAETYLSLGYSVIPVWGEADPARPKVAGVEWSRYQRRRPTTAEIHKWFLGDTFGGLAIVTGSISRLAVLDFALVVARSSVFDRTDPPGIRTVVGPSRRRLAGDDDDPRRAVGRKRLLAGDLDRPPERLVAGELESDESGDPRRRDPLQLARRRLPEERKGAARPTGVAGDRQGDPGRSRAPPEVVCGDRGRAPRHVRRNVDGEGRAAAALDRNRTPEERRDRGRQALRSPTAEGDLLEPLQERGIALSRQMVHRIVTKTPQRVNLEILAGSCSARHSRSSRRINASVTQRARLFAP